MPGLTLKRHKLIKKISNDYCFLVQNVISGGNSKKKNTYFFKECSLFDIFFLFFVFQKYTSFSGTFEDVYDENCIEANDNFLDEEEYDRRCVVTCFLFFSNLIQHKFPQFPNHPFLTSVTKSIVFFW